MFPQYSGNDRTIFNHSFALKIFGMEIPSVNDNTVIPTPQYIMQHLGNVLLYLIESVSHAPIEDGNIVFSKYNIICGFRE